MQGNGTYYAPLMDDPSVLIDLAVSSYELRLVVDPNARGFEGSIDIHAKMASEGNTFFFNLKRLDMSHWEAFVGDAQVPVTFLLPVREGPHDTFEMQFDRERNPALPASLVGQDVLLRLSFKASFSANGGMFVRHHRGDAFVFTDLEPEEAREVFPNIDRPDVKVPWTITLDVPRGMPAYSNMPEASRVALPSAFDRVSFAPTPPLPSYLVSVAVGPLQEVPVPGTPLPTRFLLPASYVMYAGPAVAALPAIMQAAERIVDMPLPFAKHDFVGVPDFSMNGMENPGLITFDADYLTSPGFGKTPKRAELTEELAVVLAHEVAHLWFGDAVTLSQWRDLWFQEGFATYVSYRVLDAVFPHWHVGLSEIAARRQPEAIDRLVGAPPVRPASVTTPTLIFSPTTYLKGGAVIETLASAMGHDVLMATAKEVLASYFYGSIDGDKVLQIFADNLPPVFGDALGRLTIVKELFERAGLTEIEIAARCAARDNAVIVTTKTQVLSHYPLCLRIRDDQGIRRTCLPVADRAEIPTAGCASAVVVANGEGYLKFKLAPDLAARTKRHAADLTPRERFVLGDRIYP